jgi:chromate transporter
MSLWVLYLLMLKTSLSSFSGMASLPILHDEFIVQRQTITEEQLNTAVVVSRTASGPNGLHIVCVGYMIRGIPGAIVTWLAMITPAVLVLIFLRFLGGRADNPRVQSMLSSIVVTSIGLVLVTAYRLGRTAVEDVPTLLIFAASLAILLLTKAETLWVFLGSAAVMLLIYLFGVPVLPG